MADEDLQDLELVGGPASGRKVPKASVTPEGWLNRVEINGESLGLYRLRRPVAAPPQLIFVAHSRREMH